MNQDKSVILVVMQSGAGWPSFLDACRQITPNTVVVAQLSDESSRCLLDRIQARIANLQREGRSIRVAVIALCTEGTQVAEQRELARVVLDAMGHADSEERELSLLAPAVQPSERHAWLELAGALATAGAPAGVAVRVRFDDVDKPSVAQARSMALPLAASL